MKDYLLDEAAVFIAGDNYDIIWNTTDKGLAWVECNGEKFYDSENGMIKSEETVHKVELPKKALDKAKEYTIFFREVIDRKAYFPVTADELFSKTYSFRPVPDEKSDLCFYFISDTHNEYEYSSMAANKYSGKLDFLVLGGDVQNDSEGFDGIRTVFRICAAVTKGEIPVVSARGNHDTRGHTAPDYYKYTGTKNGEVYFTFTLGRLFGIILDCGEDKPDDHPEYGGVNVFEPYRRGVTEYLRKVVSDGEYKNCDHVVVFCHERTDAPNHVPFKDIYEEWTKLINRMGVDFMLCGHEHLCGIFAKGRSFFDTDTVFGFDTVVGSQCRGNKRTTHSNEPEGFTGTFISLSANHADVLFTDDKQNVLEKHIITK